MFNLHQQCLYRQFSNFLKHVFFFSRSSNSIACSKYGKLLHVWRKDGCSVRILVVWSLRHIISMSVILQRLACCRSRNIPDNHLLSKHFNWLIRLFWPMRFAVTIVSNGNNCNIKLDWPDWTLGTGIKSNLIGQNHLVNKRNPWYNWVLTVGRGGSRGGACGARAPPKIAQMKFF